MSETPEKDQTIADEFRNLGMNLVNTMRSAWESPERKKFQQEIEDGLSALASTIRMEASTFSDSPTGQRLKTDLNDLQERMRTGEVETKAREEIIKALKIINTELEKVSVKWNAPSSEGANQEAAPQSQPDEHAEK
jgi:hypothetical protein